MTNLSMYGCYRMLLCQVFQALSLTLTKKEEKKPSKVHKIERKKNNALLLKIILKIFIE